MPRSQDTKYIARTVTVIALGKDACLCVFSAPYVDGEVEVWVPYSQMGNPDDVDQNQPTCDLDIAEWLLKKNDISTD